MAAAFVAGVAARVRHVALALLGVGLAIGTRALGPVVRANALEALAPGVSRIGAAQPSVRENSCCRRELLSLRRALRPTVFSYANSSSFLCLFHRSSMTLRTMAGHVEVWLGL